MLTRPTPLRKGTDIELQTIQVPEAGPSVFPEQQVNQRLRNRFNTSDGAEDEEDGHSGRSLMYKNEENQEQFPDGGKEAYMVLFGSFFGLIVDFGIANSMGALESYVSTHQLQDIESSRVSWVFSIHLGVMYLGGIIFGEFFDKYGAKKPLILGTLLIFTGLILTSECKELYQFILLFSVITAIGTSMSMHPLIGSLSHWFLKKRAFVISFATCGGLVGSSIFPVMLQRLYDQVGFKWAIKILAFIGLFCMCVSVFFVKGRELMKKEDSADEELATSFQNDNFFRKTVEFSLLKNLKFVTLTFSVFLAEIISMSTLTYLSSYAINHNINELKSYLLITIVNVSGIPGRIVSGYLADSYGRFNIMIVTCVFTTIFIFTIWLPAGSNLALLYVFLVLFGVSSSAVLSLIGASVSQICSSTNFGAWYGKLYFYLSFLSILGIFVSSLIIGLGTKSDYRNFILFEGCLSAGSVFAWLIARHVNVGLSLCKF